MTTKTTTEPSNNAVTLRGVTYHLTELTIGEYDACVEKATDTKQNSLGEDVVTTDRNRLLKLMVQKSAGISAADYSALKMPVALKLNSLVNDLHYVDEKPDDEPAEPADGDSKGKV
jgi:hypothetical protein